MSRAEFTAAVKVKRLNFCEFKCEAIVTRDDGTKTRCNATLTRGRVNFDHEIADGLGGKATFDNCKAICRQCHSDKTRDDVAKIAQAKRREAINLGVPRHKVKIPSPPKIEKLKRDVLEIPPRRMMFKENR